jgi:hypothetical protein
MGELEIEFSTKILEHSHVLYYYLSVIITILILEHCRMFTRLFSCNLESCQFTVVYVGLLLCRLGAL